MTKILAKASQKLFNNKPIDVKNSLIEADVVIFTVGVAPCFFSRETGNFVIPKGNNASLWGDKFEFRPLLFQKIRKPSKDNRDDTRDKQKNTNSTNVIASTIKRYA